MVCMPIAILRGGGGLLVPDFQVGVHYGGVLFFAITSGIPCSRFDHDGDDAGSVKLYKRSTSVGRDEGVGRGFLRLWCVRGRGKGVGMVRHAKQERRRTAADKAKLDSILADHHRERSFDFTRPPHTLGLACPRRTRQTK